MSEDQEARCAALAKRIAELVPFGEWAIAGMACRDPDTKFTWRRMSCYWEPDDEDGWGSDILSECGQRAITAGPDWRDEATVGCLLMHYLPQHELLRTIDGRWECSAATSRLAVATRAEAILAAVVAALEVSDG